MRSRRFSVTLKHSDVDVRLAAIDSLGRVGTADAVPALREWKAVQFEGEHVRAVNAAIASIQSRLIGADHGQLALASGRGRAEPGGRRSRARDGGGRVVSGVELVVFAAVLLFIGAAKVADDLESAREWMRTQRETWADLARANGLTIDPPRAGDPYVRARRGPLTVTITPFGAPRVVAAFLTIAGLPKGLRVSHETVRTQAVRLLGVRDLLLGDPDFDAALFVEGDPLLLRAAFDEPTLGGARSGCSEPSPTRRA